MSEQPPPPSSQPPSQPPDKKQRKSDAAAAKARAKAERPLWKKKRVILPALLVLLLVVVVATTGNGPEEPEVATDDPEVEEEAERAEEAAEEAEDAQEEEDDEATDEVAEGYSIGETISMGDLEHTFHGARFAEGDEFMEPEEGSRWLVVDVEVENQGDDSEAMSSLIMWSLVDSENRSVDVTITGEEQGSLDGELGAGRSMRGEIAYDVDEDEADWELIFEPQLFGFGQGIYEFSVDDVE
jgi:hypothetical protein